MHSLPNALSIIKNKSTKGILKVMLYARLVNAGEKLIFPETIKILYRYPSGSHCMTIPVILVVVCVS